MSEAEFNLLAEPWVRVMREDCGIEEVSLADALLHAHRFKALAGELPTQNAAILRLLLAVLHAVFERVDASGEEREIETADDALDRWKELWELNAFPERPLKTYFDQQYENFWLFHPTRPFWQTATIRANASPQSEPIQKLNGAISESRHKIRLFAERSGESKTSLSNAEAARWLVCMNQYDDNTLKTGLGIAWLGKFSAIIAKGENLFATLMLNLVMLDHEGEVWDIGPASWECRWKTTEEVCTIAMPHDPVAILSSHSRFGKLERKNRMLTKYVSNKGGVCFDSVMKDEQMALWRFDKKNDCYALQSSNNNQQVWRNFRTIIAEKDGRSGLVRWNNTLVNSSLISKDSMLLYEIVSIDYDKSQHSSVDNIYFDSLQLHASLLSDLEKAYAVADEVSRCDKIAYFIGLLAKELFCASGGDPEKKTLPDTDAKERYYYEIDVPFRKWLSALRADDEDADASVRLWREQAEGIARTLAEQMIRDAGPAAFIGKTITEKEKGKGSGKKHFYSSSAAMQEFKNNMKKL